MDSETLLFLLKCRHMNIPDRISRGLWSHPPIPFKECVDAIVAHLAVNEWFPHEWHKPIPGGPVADSVTIQKVGDDRFLCRLQRSHPTAYWVLAEASETSFDNAEDAARYYLKWGMMLPGDLDGWKVVR